MNWIRATRRWTIGRNLPAYRPRATFFFSPFTYSPFTYRGQAGFSLVEVMVAMVILGIGIVGAMGVLQWAERGRTQGAQGIRALAMAESRIEAKRAAPWGKLLLDDLDADGIAEVALRDDGTEDDEAAGDGIYTASLDRESIHLAWSVEVRPPGTVDQAASAVIRARARYPVGTGLWREIELGTIRANPNYVGATAPTGNRQ